MAVVDQRGDLGKDVIFTVSAVISIAVALLGAYGSFKHNRTYLLTFALLYFIAVALQAFSTVLPTWSTVVTMALTIVQSELVRNGYHKARADLSREIEQQSETNKEHSDGPPSFSAAMGH